MWHPQAAAIPAFPPSMAALKASQTLAQSPLERVLLLAHVLKDHVHGVHCACAAESDEVVVVVFLSSLWQRLLVVLEVPMLPEVPTQAEQSSAAAAAATASRSPSSSRAVRSRAATCSRRCAAAAAAPPPRRAPRGVVEPALGMRGRPLATRRCRAASRSCCASVCVCRCVHEACGLPLVGSPR